MTTYLARINISIEDLNKFNHLNIKDTLKLTYFYNSYGERVLIEPKRDIERLNRLVKIFDKHNIKYISEYEYTE